MAELEIQSRGNPRQQQALARTVRADEEERLLRRQGRQHDGLDGREAVQPETGKMDLHVCSVPVFAVVAATACFCGIEKPSNGLSVEG